MREDVAAYHVVFNGLDRFVREIDGSDVTDFLAFLAKHGYEVIRRDTPQVYPKNTRDIVNQLVVEGELVTSDALKFHPDAHNKLGTGAKTCYVLREDLA